MRRPEAVVNSAQDFWVPGREQEERGSGEKETARVT
jgi:hypothetical protein